MPINPEKHITKNKFFCSQVAEIRFVKYFEGFLISAGKFQQISLACAILLNLQHSNGNRQKPRKFWTDFFECKKTPQLFMNGIQFTKEKK